MSAAVAFQWCPQQLHAVRRCILILIFLYSPAFPVSEVRGISFAFDNFDCPVALTVYATRR